MLLTNLAILVLAGFAGYLTISKVPNTLHTPLMSGTNAIHGIVVLGGIIVLGLGVEGVLSKLLLVIAIAFGTINVVGGFLVTDRMLEMFKGRPREDRQASGEPEQLGPGAGADARGATPPSTVEARERAPGGGDAS
jgi:NAD(P) transhydrogenase subunit alpha